MTGQQKTEEPTTLGAYLKRLRSEKNISVAEVAARMYLHPSVIDALEQDDHKNLPGSLYVYGYLQHYAKILNVPADQILSMYKKDTSEPREQGTEAPIYEKPDTKEPKKWSYAIIYLALFILVLLSFVFWRGKYAQEPVETTGGPDRTATIVEQPDTPPGQAQSTEMEEAEQETYTADMPVRETEQEPETTPEPAGESQTTRAQQPETPTTTTEAEPGTAPTYEEKTITAGIGPDTVKLVLSIDCWIEIFDADNEKVFYDLARVGQTLVLSGNAPFSVLLGNADAATVEFNNTPFDITPHVTGIGIARFVLGEAE
ncbi:MAG: helix-turn-helix domain-containing protein [Gammaproteobacteria bacterium]|nr:helix-turn-helix domain-containing protein [Gammaproteobacteria bacterium]